MLHKLLTAIGLRKENLPEKRPPRPEVTLSEAELEAVYQQLERMHILMVEAEEDNFSTGVRMATDKLRAAIDHPESRSKLFYEATDTFMSMWGGMGSLTDFYIASAPSGELEARQDEYHTLALALSDFFRAHS